MLLMTLVGCLMACGPSDDGPAPEPDTPQSTEDPLINGWALTFYDNSTTPYVFVNEQDIVATVVDNDNNGTFDGSLIRTAAGTLQLEFDERTGRPQQITTSLGETMLFEFKDEGNLVDIAYIFDGAFQYVRDVVYENPNKEALYHSTLNQQDTDLIDAFILTGNILSTVMSGAFCTAAVAATISSIGVAAPSLWTCAGFFTSLSSLIISSGAVEANPELFRGAGLAALSSEITGCVGRNPANCANAFLGIVSELKRGIDNVKVENGPEISAALGALQSGFGQVKVTLTWTSNADLDLWVTEPNGNRIYYANPSSSTGGFLDFDDLDGPGPENIFWEENAPTGNYVVQVHNFSSNGAASSSYTVQTEINGIVSAYNGTISMEDQVNTVAEFQIGSNKSAITKARDEIGFIHEPLPIKR